MGTKLSKVHAHEQSRSQAPIKYEFKYTTKQYMEKELDSLADRLVSNGYECSDSGHAFIMLGPTGCGKTDILKEYTLKNNDREYKFKYSDGSPYSCLLKVLYISNEYLSYSDGLIRYIQHMIFPDVPITLTDPKYPQFKIHPIDDLIQLLKKNHIYLLVILDHMDQVLYDKSLDNLYGISNLALTTSGRIAMVGCTSSSILYPILTGHDSIVGDNLKLEFEVTKLRTICAATQGDKLTIRHIPGYSKYPVDMSIFASGSSYIDRFCLDYPNTHNFALAIFDKLIKNNNNPLKDYELPAIYSKISGQPLSFYSDTEYKCEKILSFFRYDLGLFKFIYSSEYEPHTYNLKN
jgi:hypothetical protein